MKKYGVELVGTFFLFFTIAMTVLAPGAGAMAPLAIGSVLAVMIFAGGHVSGGHFNPAVTLAVFLRGKCSSKDVPGYMVAQVAGASLAALAAYYLKYYSCARPISLDRNHALLAEFLFTFALAWVVLNVATAKGTQGNSFYGFGIGFTVLVGAYSVGSVSGGSFNPAVSVGGAILGFWKWADLWIYLVAELAGGAAAAFAFTTLVEKPEKAPSA